MHDLVEFAHLVSMINPELELASCWSLCESWFAFAPMYFNTNIFSYSHFCSIKLQVGISILSSHLLSVMSQHLLCAQ
jgi:hypothetical protein